MDDEQVLEAARRLWPACLQTGKSQSQFEYARRLLVGPPSAERACRLGLDKLITLAPDRPDECAAMLRAWAEDWRKTRDLILLGLAAGPPEEEEADRSDWLQDVVIARAAELGLTAYAVAQRTSGKVSEDHVRAYLMRSKSMGSHKLQHVLRALGLAVAPQE